MHGGHLLRVQRLRRIASDRPGNLPRRTSQETSAACKAGRWNVRRKMSSSTQNLSNQETFPSPPPGMMEYDLINSILLGHRLIGRTQPGNNARASEPLRPFRELSPKEGPEVKVPPTCSACVWPQHVMHGVPEQQRSRCWLRHNPSH